MPNLQIIDPISLANLRQIRRPQVFELVAVYWPAPDGLKFYGSTKLDELKQFPPDSSIVAPIEPRLPAYQFQAFNHISDISDDSIQLQYYDGDGEIRRLFRTHGEGIKVELFYYFPEIDTLVSQWWGHFRPPESADGFKFPARAQSGFRSALLTLPRRILGTRCGWIFGGRFSTQAEIDQGGCPWNLHIGGGVGVPGSELLPMCNQTSRAVCAQYLGDTLSFGGFETVIESVVNNQSKGPTLYPVSRGNETNLKRPLRVLYGHIIVRDLDLLAFTPQTNTKHPDQGFVRALFAVGDGELQSMFNCKVNGSIIGFQHLNVRLGQDRQSPTAFSPNVNNYSGTSLFFGVYGPVNPAQYNEGNLKGEAEVFGRNTIRVYTDANTYTEQYTTNRAWVLFDLYTNKRYGHGVSVSRFVIEDWIELAAWCDELAGYADAEGEHFTGTRSTFNGEINERSAQQTIEDICMAGRFSLPFRHNGKIRILPLRKETIDENVPVFSDQGENRNIILGSDGNSTLTWSEKSDAELINELVLTFIDADHGHVERPLTFSDQPAQLAAGRAMGDDTVRIIKGTENAFGITHFGEASRLGNLILDLGKFDDGGLKNNLEVRFQTSAVGLGMELWKYRLIKVVSPKVADYPFQYFRVKERNRKSDLVLEIVAQAYPVDYYDRLEDVTEPPPIIGSGGDGNPGGGPGDTPCGIGFRQIAFKRDYLDLQLEIC